MVTSKSKTKTDQTKM